jgi:nitroreductase
MKAFLSKDPVPRDDIEKVLDAARMAPTSGNQQPWKFLFIDDAETIRRKPLEEFIVYGSIVE